MTPSLKRHLNPSFIVVTLLFSIWSAQASSQALNVYLQVYGAHDATCELRSEAVYVVPLKPGVADGDVGQFSNCPLLDTAFLRYFEQHDNFLFLGRIGGDAPRYISLLSDSCVSGTPTWQTWILNKPGAPAGTCVAMADSFGNVIAHVQVDEGRSSLSKPFHKWEDCTVNQNPGGACDMLISELYQPPAVSRGPLFVQRGPGAVAPMHIAAAANPMNAVSSAPWILLSCVDFDGDGWVDCVVVEYEDQAGSWCAVKYYRNMGTVNRTTPVFEEQASNPLSAATGSGFGLAPECFDVNGDGLPDCIFGTANGTLIYWRNVGSASQPAFARQPESANPFGENSFGEVMNPEDGGGHPAFPSCVDVDADGDVDCFIATNKLMLAYFNTGNRTNPIYTREKFNSARAMYLFHPYQTVLMDWAVPDCFDIDNDGDADCMFGTATGRMQFFLNKGTAKNPGFAELKTDVMNPFSDRTWVFTSSQHQGSIARISPECADFDRLTLTLTPTLTPTLIGFLQGRGRRLLHRNHVGWNPVP